MNKQSLRFLQVLIFVYLAMQGTAFSSNTYEQYITVENLFRMGEYEQCISIGDSIDDVENLYDAEILGYSALSNIKIAFSESSINNKGIIPKMQSLINHAEFKAKYALKYFDTVLDQYFETALRESSSSSKKNWDVKSVENLLNVCNLATKCCKITDPNRVEHYIQLSYLISHSKKVNHTDVCIELQKLYYEILDNMYDKDYEFTQEVLLDDFEEMLFSIPRSQRDAQIKAAEIYLDLSQSLNEAAMEYRHDDHSPIAELALNTLIKSRDYSLYARSYNEGLFKPLTWKEIKNEMDNDAIASIYFQYTKGHDSWNYVFIFDKNCEEPRIELAGSAYRAESQSMNQFRSDYQEYGKYYIVGTNNMSQITYPEYHTYGKIIRLYSISDILKKVNTYDKLGYIAAFANINYSDSDNLNTNISTEKGLSRKYGSFASAEREVNSLREIFSDKLILYQGDAATKNKFKSLNNNVRILHVSTHGVFDKNKLLELNEKDPAAGITGENILRSCSLILSGYNDKSTNVLTAYDIIKQDYSNIDLVFLSACQSGSGRVLADGDYSLVSAFKMAGAKNIVAILDPINEEDATKFAEFFYKQIYSGDSYHDAFYAARRKVSTSARMILIQ